MEWWEQFFDGDWVQIHANFWTIEETASQADGIERYLGLEPAGTVLDVPCGEGRIARQLALRGYRVTGVDQSSALLDIARQAATTAGLDINWEQRDMRDLPWSESFDGVVCWWGSFGYFDDGSNAAFLEAAAHVLKPGGRLVLETHTVETVLPVFQNRGWHKAGEGFALTEARWDHMTGRIEQTWTILRDGQTTVNNSSFRLYTYAQLIELLTSVGFLTVRGVDPVNDSDFQLGSRKLIFVAEK